SNEREIPASAATASTVISCSGRSVSMRSPMPISCLRRSTGCCLRLRGVVLIGRPPVGAHAIEQYSIRMYRAGMDFALSPRAAELRQKVADFIETEIAPVEDDYLRTLRELDDPWDELPVIEQLKQKAREQGVWNFFLPPAKAGITGYPGLSNVDYAPLAELMGR